jgi:hypothetical protein
MRLQFHWPRVQATDLWQVGVIAAPIAQVMAAEHVSSLPITWLPKPRPFTFIADPFASRDAQGNLCVLVEALDYREKRGEIHFYRYSPEMQLIDSGVAMRSKHHLSYPYLIAHAGETYMLPECYRSGVLTLYRAVEFPHRWEKVRDILPFPCIDASVIQYQGRWWMFYARPGENQRALRELHIAYADDLLGEWHQHPQNPVRIGLDASRMGGTPFEVAGTLFLPMQDCTRTYGGAINLLQIITLTPDSFAAECVKTIAPQGLNPEYPDGVHTLSACGELTLIDVKRILNSPRRWLINWQRRLRRLRGL